jgi:serine/threonine protein kinase
VTLSAGTRLGPYEILSPIGAGGMGEVYRARDTRLGREVAVKVLPSHMSSSPEVRQRFEREAKTISQLSHAHICALYDVGREGATEYLVMEYLEGETLLDRLAKGPLPLEQTLRYGTEIADALDKAHRQGIVHRDLKPGNVMLTKSGVKLLDFGLAKAMAPAAPKSSLTALPTQANLTEAGTILGTFQYMAPEQLEGKEADARSDIFAFGSVLYEMATGRKAFSGASQASLIGAILHTEPQPISAVEPMTPPALERVVKTCLAKDPEDRFQTAHDAKLQLEWIAEGGSVIGLPATVAARRKSRELLAWIIAALATGAALALAVSLLRDRREPPRIVQSSILPPEKSLFFYEDGPMAVSPDGTRLAFIAANPEGKYILWIRPLSGMAAQPLAGTERASYPFWSPDSRFVGFFSGGKLKKIDSSGGPPQTLCDAQLARGGTWGTEGVILFTPSPREPISRVSSAGGGPVPVTALDLSRREFSHRFPYFLPDGRHFLFLSQAIPSGDPKEADVVYAGALDSKERKLLLRVRSNVLYVPPSRGAAQGHLLFARERTVVAQPFDPKSLSLSGEPVPVGEGVVYYTNFGFAVFTASHTGTLVYQSGGAGGVSELVWLDRSGKRLSTVGAPADYLRPRVSHDGRRIAVDIIDPTTGRSDVWTYDLARNVATRLTFGPTDNNYPIWSPDDLRIAFTSNRNGTGDLYEKPSSGTGDDKPVFLDPTSFKVISDWSQDGAFLAYHAISTMSRAGWDLWTFSLADKKPALFLSTPATESMPIFSPDGRWLVYVSDESGRYEVYVQPFPGRGGKWQISPEGGNQPVWGPDGRELFYMSLDNKLMAVDVRTASGFEAGTPRVLFETRLKGLLGRRYDISPDGTRFLVNSMIGEVKANPMTLVQNWAVELKKK